MTTTKQFTVRDLDSFPEDDNSYEAIDGTLLVRAVPGERHRLARATLTRLLRQAAPDNSLIVGRFAVRQGENTQVRPDIIVAPREDVTDQILPTAPMLAVEVLPTGGGIHEFHTKKALYERMGTPHYWVVDPIDPAITVFELDEQGQYQQIAEVEGDGVFEVTRPFPVRLVPNALSDP